MAALNNGKKTAPRFWRSLRIQVGIVPRLLLPLRLNRTEFIVTCDEASSGTIALAIDGSPDVSLTTSGNIPDSAGIGLVTSGPLYAVASENVMVNVYEMWE